MKHVILGNGPAGVIAAETMRKHAPDRHDRARSATSSQPPYSRMAIPYLLMGNITRGGNVSAQGRRATSRSLGIEPRTDRALEVDTGARSVRFASGPEQRFDRLLIATGSVPVRAPIPGIDLPGVNPAGRSPMRARSWRRRRPGARVLQIGAGFIGCIIMEALAARGVQLTVVEMGDRMVPRMMGKTAGDMIRRWVEGKGVRVYTSTRVEAIEPDQPLSARLSNGKRLIADLVISATGVQPNIQFLEGSDIGCLRGVLTDERMQTNIPGIYAAGDCAEALDAVSGKTIVSAIQPNAADQAYCAAMNMAGRNCVLRGVTQINVLDSLGLISTSFGRWEGVPGGERAEVTDEQNFRHVRLEFDGDVLVGSNAIGLTEHVGVFRGLIESRVRLGAWKDRLLRDPMLLPEAYLARAQAQEARAARPA